MRLANGVSQHSLQGREIWEGIQLETVFVSKQSHSKKPYFNIGATGYQPRLPEVFESTGNCPGLLHCHCLGAFHRRRLPHRHCRVEPCFQAYCLRSSPLQEQRASLRWNKANWPARGIRFDGLEKRTISAQTRLLLLRRSPRLCSHFAFVPKCRTIYLRFSIIKQMLGTSKNAWTSMVRKYSCAQTSTNFSSIKIKRNNFVPEWIKLCTSTVSGDPDWWFVFLSLFILFSHPPTSVSI